MLGSEIENAMQLYSKLQQRFGLVVSDLWDDVHGGSIRVEASVRVNVKMRKWESWTNERNAQMLLHSLGRDEFPPELLSVRSQMELWVIQETIKMDQHVDEKLKTNIGCHWRSNALKLNMKSFQGSWVVLLWHLSNVISSVYAYLMYNLHQDRY